MKFQPIDPVGITCFTAGPLAARKIRKHLDDLGYPYRTWSHLFMTGFQVEPPTHQAAAELRDFVTGLGVR